MKTVFGHLKVLADPTRNYLFYIGDRSASISYTPIACELISVPCSEMPPFSKILLSITRLSSLRCSLRQSTSVYSAIRFCSIVTCDIYILLDVLLCSIAEYFYELCRILVILGSQHPFSFNFYFMLI